MNTQIKIIFRALILFAVIMAVGCKQEAKKPPTEAEPEIIQEINYDSLHAAVEAKVLANGGATIFLEIINPDSLFKSNDPSFIQTGNPNLRFIAMKSTGKPGDDRSTDQDTTAKDFESNVYVGKTVAWILRPKSRDQYKFHFQEVDFGQGNISPNGTEPCNGFTIKRGKPETHGENQGAIITQVINNSELENCRQRYTLIFSLENQSGEKRWFTLDPWVLIK
ncbi:MAG: hypothetical protein P8X60_06780 [Robiginitalea sp.]